MKSQKTMLALVRQTSYDFALENDDTLCIDLQGQKLIGYWLPYSKILSLYLQEGFTESALKKHLAIWKQLGFSRNFGKIIFFIPNSEDIVQIKALKLKIAEHPEAIVISSEVAA